MWSPAVEETPDSLLVATVVRANTERVDLLPVAHIGEARARPGTISMVALPDMVVGQQHALKRSDMHENQAAAPLQRSPCFIQLFCKVAYWLRLLHGLGRLEAKAGVQTGDRGRDRLRGPHPAVSAVAPKICNMQRTS